MPSWVHADGWRRRTFAGPAAFTGPPWSAVSAVVVRESGEFAGDCGLTPQRVDGVDEIEVGYHIRADLQGNGYATEAAAACRDFARDVLGVRRLIAIIDPANAPSQRVAVKIGLEREKTATVLGGERVVHAGAL